MLSSSRFTALWPICGPTGQSSAFLTARSPQKGVASPQTTGCEKLKTTWPIEPYR